MRITLFCRLHECNTTGLMRLCNRQILNRSFQSSSDYGNMLRIVERSSNHGYRTSISRCVGTVYIQSFSLYSGCFSFIKFIKILLPVDRFREG